MAKQDFSTHLRQYYEEKQPSVAKLAHLLEMTDTVDRLASKTGKDQKKLTATVDNSARNFRLSLGLSLTLAAMLIFFFFLPTADITKSVTKEIVLNHNKALALEFLTENYAELRKKMPKLDFNLVDSKQMNAQGFRIMGARYCSIQGEIAAQIRLQDDTGQIYTLYQTTLTDPLLKLEAGEQEQEGLKLKLWREAGLLFGLVGPIN